MSMKTLTLSLLAVLSLALPAQADQVSLRVLNAAKAALAKACPATVKYYPVAVESVAVREISVDQGQVDIETTVVYEVTEDRGDNVYSTVMVKAMEYDLSNPSAANIEVVSVSGSGCY